MGNWFVNEIKGFGLWVFNGVVGASYGICLTVAMIALILYIAGFKKWAKFIPFSLLLYYLLLSIKSVL